MHNCFCKKMKFPITLVFVFALISAEGQTTPPILKVEGKSQISVKPTLTEISLDIRAINPTYAGSVEALIKRVDLLTNVLKEIRFRDDEIITSNFRVAKNTVYIRGERKDSGFIATQTLKVQFSQEKKRLLEVLNTATSSRADPEISISFKLDDERKRSLKAELIKLAVSDAKMKAELIAKEAGYEISGVREIQYGLKDSGQDELYSVANAEFLERSLDVQISNFEAADLTFYDNVKVIYNIEKEQ